MYLELASAQNVKTLLRYSTEERERDREKKMKFEKELALPHSFTT